jgi:Tfp pilus assembly protein PilN
MKIKPLLYHFFSNKTTLRLGVSRTSRISVYALTIMPAKGKPAVIWAGKGMPLWVRLIAPPVLHGDLGSVPVYEIKALLNGKDTEAWIDANESTIIPQGVSPEQIVSEYATIGSAIYAATVLKPARDAAAAPPEQERPFVALYAPLWNLAKIYGAAINAPFILWRILSDGSTFGLVRDGHCEKLVNCHVSRRDLETDPEQSVQTVRQFVHSLSGKAPDLPVIAFTPENDFALPAAGAIPGITLLPVLRILHVPAFCHEAWANSCGNDQELNFISFEALQKTRKIEKRDRSLRSILRIGLLTVVALFLILAGADGVLRIVDKKYSGPMEQLATETAVVKIAEKRHGKLLEKVRDKLRFATERSRVTGLLSDLQSVLPENAWAETISITMLEQDRYQVEIVAVTTESGLLGDALKNFGAIAGVNDSRLVSSEQVTLPGKNRAVRFKIKGLWRFSNGPQD